MVETASPLLLNALARAAGTPDGLPLRGGKVGLFPGTSPGRRAAQAALANGHLRVVRTEKRGKAVSEHCGLTDHGLDLLLQQADPSAVLERLLAAIEARQGELHDLSEGVRHCAASLDELRRHTQRTLERVRTDNAGIPTPSQKSAQDWKALVPAFLRHWAEAHPAEDCPLPELYREVQQNAPGLTLGQFHDGIRALYEHEQVHLHPWTGPMHEIPDPALAMLIGHALAYYVSVKEE